MSAGKAGASFALHQTGRGMAILILGRLNANVARAFLHDDAENDALFHTKLGSLFNGIEDEANVRAGVTGLEHGWLVEVEERDEVFPLLLWRKAGSGTAMGFSDHVDSGEVDGVLIAFSMYCRRRPVPIRVSLLDYQEARLAQYPSRPAYLYLNS